MQPTNIYEFFACFSRLPVAIDVVVEQLRDMGVMDSIEYYEVDTNPADIAGMCRVYTSKPPYGDRKRHAQIVYSGRLSPEWQRLIVCKELLHLLDAEHERAHTREQVSRLIDEMVVPIAAGVSVPAFSDHIGLLNALKVLLPRDALGELAALHQQGKITAEYVAAAAQVPLSFAEFALTPRWLEIIDKIS